MDYALYTYDVWGNDEDGYEVNNVFGTDDVAHITEDLDDNDITLTLIKQGIVNENCKGKLVYEGEFDYTLYASWINTGKPAFELRGVNHD